MGFGNLNLGIADANSYRYRSYYFDYETGLYYLQSRYYDQETGRFINADDASIILSLIEDPLINGNIYAYCGNDSIKHIDPSGTVRVVGIGIYNWQNETISGANYIASYYKLITPGEKSKSYMTLVTYNNNDFITAWTRSTADIMFINTHGTPSYLAGEGASRNLHFTKNDVGKLPFKKIKCLILLGCNTAHFRYVWSNIAFAFKKKISGLVFAADGTVAYGYENGHYIYNPVGDSTWRNIWTGSSEWLMNRIPQAKGWLIYYKNSCYNTTLHGYVSLTDIIYYLRRCGMI